LTLGESINLVDKLTRKAKGPSRSKAWLQGLFYNHLPSIEDREHVFHNGPYSFNSTGLHLGIWKEELSPEKEEFTVAPVWIQIYSLPQEF